MSENGTNLPDSADIDLNTDIAAMLDADNPDFDAVMESIKDVGPINAQMDPMAASNPPMENAIDFGAQVMQPIKTKEEIERERMNLLVSHFDEQQMARYAAFRRANIRRASVKRYASQLLSQPISNNVAVVLAGMSQFYARHTQYLKGFSCARQYRWPPELLGRMPFATYKSVASLRQTSP